MVNQVALVSTPTLVIGPFNNMNKKGFSLIEILVVLVIIAITTTLAILSFHFFDKGKETENKALILTTTLRQMERIALLTKTPMKLVFSSHQATPYLLNNQSLNNKAIPQLKRIVFNQPLSLSLRNPIKQKGELLITTAFDTPAFRFLLINTQSKEQFFITNDIDGNITYIRDSHEAT